MVEPSTSTTCGSGAVDRHPAVVDDPQRVRVGAPARAARCCAGGRSRRARSPRSTTSRPVSSCTSRTTASRGSSPCSRPPPGSVHSSLLVSRLASRESRMRSSRTMTAYAATRCTFRTCRRSATSQPMSPGPSRGARPRAASASSSNDARPLDGVRRRGGPGTRARTPPAGPVLGQPLELLEPVVQPPAELERRRHDVRIGRHRHRRAEPHVDQPPAREVGPRERRVQRPLLGPEPLAAPDAHRHQRRSGLPRQGHRAGHQGADDVRRRDAALGEDADDLALAEQPPGLEVGRRRGLAGRRGCAASGPSPSRPGSPRCRGGT